MSARQEQIVERLADGYEATADTMAREFGVTAQALASPLRALVKAERITRRDNGACWTYSIAKAVTDCCGRLLPVTQTLVGDVHLTEQCPACSHLAAGTYEGQPHDRHRTCDWTQIGCPGSDWTYSGDPANPVAAL